MAIIYKKKKSGIPTIPCLKENKTVYKLILSTIEDVETGTVSINHAVGFLHGLAKMDSGSIRVIGEWHKIIHYIKNIKL